MTLAIVTATTDPFRAADCLLGWETQAAEKPQLVVVVNGREFNLDEANRLEFGAHWIVQRQYLGTVPAFRLGVDELLRRSDPPEIIACLHDDFEILESGWDQKVIRHFQRHERCGLLGFGGATRLGASTLYQEPYDPMQLARIGFRSNLEDAEIHGVRSLLPERVACLDGFSQIGRRAFWLGLDPRQMGSLDDHRERPWTALSKLGIVHHFYDGALGCLARRYGWETWYLPLRGQHYGGQTAVGDAGYAEWAQQQIAGGDRGFWEAAHRAGYENFRDVLPLRT